MRFRFCCTCDDEEEKVKTIDDGKGIPSSTVVPTTITQQPKQIDPIQLDKITEVSVEESSTSFALVKKKQPNVPVPKREEPSPAKVEEQQSTVPAFKTQTEELPPARTQEEQSTPPETREQLLKTELMNQLMRLMEGEKAIEKATLAKLAKAPMQFPTPPTQSHNSESNITIDSSIGDEKVTFAQVAPGQYNGTYRGTTFWVTASGKIYDESGTYSEYEKEVLANIYSKAMDGLKKGKETMEGGTLVENNLPTGSNININYVTPKGEKAVMTFVCVKPGHLRSNFNGKDFSMILGRIVETSEPLDDYEKQIIMTNFEQAMLGMKSGLLGMQRGMLGMQQGMLGMQTGMLRMNNNLFGSTVIDSGGTAYASTSMGGTTFASATGGSTHSSVSVGGSKHSSAFAVSSGRETIRRGRLADHKNRISILEGGPLAEPRPPMIIEDITDTDRNSLPEPVLQKTTFTPNVIVYEDPKEYEPQDDNELPAARRLDEFIISADENLHSENRYHFHAARPPRVKRPNLDPKDKLRLASPTRYSLFENECLKAHNDFRKLHGVPPLVHSEFLSEVAKEWAEHLALKNLFDHRPKNEYGENLYRVSGMAVCGKTAVEAWYEEIDLYDYDKPGFSTETGHFTQVIWKDTREVGTGIAQVGDMVVVCCNYHPRGNYTNQFNDEFVPRPLKKISK